VAQKNVIETQTSIQKLPEIAESEDVKSSTELSDSGEADSDVGEADPIIGEADPVIGEADPIIGEADQDIDSILNSLKALLNAVEKLQKVRQDVGNIKPLLGRMLDGELISGEELEQLKVGVNGLLRLVRAYTDHQAALAKAQPARSLLDQVLKGHKPNEPEAD
jgi:DNA repair ATPase RecN